jgi:hypothetical protein
MCRHRFVIAAAAALVAGWRHIRVYCGEILERDLYIAMSL